jgi:hypothetical protein
VSGEVVKVLKACNENAKGIDKLSDTMTSFVKQLLGHFEEGLPLVKLPSGVAIWEATGKMVADGYNDPSLATKVGDVTLRGTHLLDE